MERKNLIIATAVLLVVIGIVIWYKNAQKQAKKFMATFIDEDKLNAPLHSDKDNFPLRVGSEGKKVEQLQLYLKEKRGAKLSKQDIDGIFGKKTLANVSGFLGTEEVGEDLFKQKRMTDFKTFVFPESKDS